MAQYSTPPPQSATPSWQQLQLQQGYQAPRASLDTLNSDIANLISGAKIEFAQNPYDGSIQSRLKALLDLQSILSTQQLPSDQLGAVRDQVAHLSLAAKSTSQTQAPPKPMPPPAPVVVAQPSVQQPSLSSLLGPGALAALMARSSATPVAQTPPPPQPVVPVPSPQRQYSQPPYVPPPAVAVPSAPASASSSLLDQLRAAGMLPAMPATPSTSTPTIPTIPLSHLTGTVPPGFPPPLPFLNSPSHNGRPALTEIRNDVQLKSASLKM